MFTLPKVSAKTKFKLTAHEGCRVRKVALATFASVACEDYAETCLACLTNLGDVHVFSVPGLRPQVHYTCIRKEDISGIASCVFTRHGQGEGPGRQGRGRSQGFWEGGGIFTALSAPHPPAGFYLISPSEFERFSLSARNITEPLCSLDISWPHDAMHARCVEGVGPGARSKVAIPSVTPLWSQGSGVGGWGPGPRAMRHLPLVPSTDPSLQLQAPRIAQAEPG